MKITQEEVLNRQTVLEIKLDEVDIEPYLEKTYRKIVQRSSIPGFRKGKAPRSIIENYYGKEHLVSESLDDMVPEITQRAIEDQDLEASAVPKLELVGLSPVVVKATVPLVPEVNLGEYRDIRVAEDKIDINVDDIESRIDEMKTQAGIWEPVNKAVAYGNRVTMKVTGHVEENTVLDSDDEEYLVEENGTLPFKGFPENLIGSKIDEPFEFHLDIPEDYADSRLAGKEGHFEVNLKEIKELVLPELDDEFAKSVGDGYDNVSDLKTSIENKLIEEAEQAKDTKHRDQSLDKLIEGSSFEFPPLLIEQEISHMVDRRNNFASQMNFSLEEYFKFTGKTEQEHEKEMREHAIERFSRSYALSKLVEAENIEVSDNEVDEKIEELKNRDTEDGAKLDDQKLKSPEVLSSIRESLLVEKSLATLVSITKGDDDSPKPNAKDENIDQRKEK